MKRSFFESYTEPKKDIPRRVYLMVSAPRGVPHPGRVERCSPMAGVLRHLHADARRGRRAFGGFGNGTLAEHVGASLEVVLPASSSPRSSPCRSA